MKVRSFDQQVDDFIKNLDKPSGTKTVRLITMLQKFGSNLRMPYSKSLNQGLFELRARGQKEIRIFYTFSNSEAILLHGFIKKTQKTPLKEMRIALYKLQALKKN